MIYWTQIKAMPGSGVRGPWVRDFCVSNPLFRYSARLVMKLMMRDAMACYRHLPVMIPAHTHTHAHGVPTDANDPKRLGLGSRSSTAASARWKSKKGKFIFYAKSEADDMSHRNWFSVDVTCECRAK